MALEYKALAGCTPRLAPGAAAPDAALLESAAAYAPGQDTAAGVLALQTKAGVGLGTALAALGDGERVLAVNLAATQPLLAAALAEGYLLLLAFGAAYAARLAGAKDVRVVGVEAGAVALAEATAALDTGLTVTAVAAEQTPVLREDSALLAVLEGRPCRSELLDAPLAQSGVEGKPTLALDAETLVWLAVSAAGGEAVQNKLAAVEGAVVPQGEALPEGTVLLAEMPLGVPLAAVAEELGLPSDKPLLAGGVTGVFYDAAALGETAVAYSYGFDSLKAYGKADCMADVGKRLATEIADTSCGKCVLCREGSWQFKAIFTDIAEGRGRKGDFDLVADIGTLIPEGAFCDYGRDMVRPALGLVQYCRPELDAHITKKTCPAGVCDAFKEFVIDPGKCDGCGDCMDVCPEDAIDGKPGFIHMINPVLCTKCGKCREACEQCAVVVPTGRMKLPKKLTRVGRFK